LLLKSQTEDGKEDDDSLFFYNPKRGSIESKKFPNWCISPSDHGSGDNLVLQACKSTWYQKFQYAVG
jgi:hypothetical protein